jgi:hypothetical protein
VVIQLVAEWVTEKPWIDFRNKQKNFSLFLNVQMRSEVKPASYLMDAGAFFARGYSGLNVKLITHI